MDFNSSTVISGRSIICNCRDPPPFTYEGKQYTAYKAQQQMRKMERAMRKQKDRCIVADAAGDTQTFTAASIKLRRQKDIYEDFCKAAGTYTEYERTFVAGYNRKLAAKTGAVTRAQNKFKNAQITLTNPGNGGIIKLEAKQMNNRRISNVYTGIRSETPLSSEDKKRVTEYLTALNVNMDNVIFTDVYRTAYNEKFDAYIIGTDVKPLEDAKNGVINANQRITVKGTLAHEVIGHREAHIKGLTQRDDILEEVQASIRAARFAPGLSNSERITLLMDARSRLGFGRRLKDVRDQLHIDER